MTEAITEIFKTWGTEMAECVCPECGVIYWKRLDVSYIVDTDIQKRAGYIVIMCKECGASMAVEDNNKIQGGE